MLRTDDTTSSFCLKLISFVGVPHSKLQSVGRKRALALFFTAEMEERQNGQSMYRNIDKG